MLLRRTKRMIRVKQVELEKKEEEEKLGYINAWKRKRGNIMTYRGYLLSFNSFCIPFR